MAKTSGFAALAALQNQIETTQSVEETKTPVTQEPTPALFESVEDEQKGIEEESFHSSAEESNITDKPNTVARGETPYLVQIDEMAYLTTEDKDVAPAEPVFDAPVVEPVVKKSLNDIPVIEWSINELENYIAGQVDCETYVTQLKAAVTEHRKRESTLAKAWTVEECRAYFLKGTVPAKTSKGAWVKDVTRQYRREHEWETNELESWALGEIKAEGATTDGGLAVELKQRLNLPLKSFDVQAIITNYRYTTAQVNETREETRPEPQTQEVSEARIAEVTKAIQLEGVTPVNQSYIDSSLAQFEAVMKPGRAITERTAGDAQTLLRDVIRYAIQLPDPVGSRSAMQYLLEYFRARRGIGQIFEDTYAFRGIPDMRGTKKDQVAHHDLLTLFLVYADSMVELRAQTDIPSLIGNVNPQFQSRVLEFFARQ